MRQVSPHATTLRRDLTDVERKLWYAVRDRRLDGWKFRRQATAEFTSSISCSDARLTVELDGGQHDAVADAPRTAALEARGYQVLRFWNFEVNDNFNGVLLTIAAALGKRL